MPAYGYSQSDLCFLNDTGIDPHEIVTGTNRYGVRYATIGHYRVIYFTKQGGDEAQVKIDFADGPAWVSDAGDEMPTIVYESLLAACKRCGR